MLAKAGFEEVADRLVAHVGVGGEDIKEGVEPLAGRMRGIEEDLTLAADGADASAIVLASLVVDEALKTQGVDERLLAAGLESARAAGVRLAFALGDRDFLGRFGFSVETGARFDCAISGALLGLVLDDEWEPESGKVEFPGAGE